VPKVRAQRADHHPLKFGDKEGATQPNPEPKPCALLVAGRAEGASSSSLAACLAASGIFYQPEGLKSSRSERHLSDPGERIPQPR
jgi:hypothetical protein